MRSTLSTPLIAVGNTPDNAFGGDSDPRATVQIVAPQSDRLTEMDSITLTSFSSSMLTSLAVRDVNRDGTDEIVTAYSSLEMSDLFGGACTSATLPGTCSPHESGSVVEVRDRFLTSPVELLNNSGASASDIGPGAVVALGDFDADTIRVQATGMVYLHTGRPFVNAVLAAPPTWIGRPGVMNTDSSQTSFGTAMTTGSSDTRTINASASTTVSAGASFGVVEFSASVTASFEYSSSMTTTHEVSYGTETSVGDDADLVLFRAVPYASYEYRVLSHPDAAQIGTFMTIDVPGRMIETVRSLADFRAEYGSQADDVIPPGLFAHTIGDPSTYRHETDCTTVAIQAGVGTAGTISSPYRSPTLRDVGSASSGGVTQSISISDQTGSATEIGLSVEMSVGVGAGGVSVEASAGVGASWSHETTVGRDVSYTGSVGYIASGYGIDTRYEWGLCVFHFTNASYGSYPVVDYVVRRY